MHYLINRSGKCHSGLARQESSKITSLTVLPVLQSVDFFLLLLIISNGYSKLFESNNVRFSRTSYQIQSFINQEVDTYGQSIAILPRPKNIFKTFSIPLDEVKVLILGQDVYPNIRKHKENKELFQEEAMGLAFSVPEEIKIPPSLRNVFKEIDRKSLSLSLSLSLYLSRSSSLSLS